MTWPPAVPVSPGIAIVRRELLTGLRDKKPFYFLAAVLFVMIFSAAFMLNSIDLNTQTFGGAAGGRDVRQLFMLYSMGLYAAAVLLIPPMAAVSICIEKQQGSYELLKMTYIRPLSIALSKFISVLGIYTIVVIATLPIAGVFFFLVGIDWAQFTQSFLVIVSSAVCCAAVGTFCSAWFYRTIPAVITTYGICIVLQGGFLMFLACLAGTVGQGTWLARLPRIVGEDFLFSLAPMFSIFRIGENDYSFKGAVFTFMLYGGISVLAFYGALVLIRRPLGSPHDRGRPSHEPEHPSTPEGRLPRLRFGFRRRLISDRSNPMLQKELRTGLFGRRKYPVWLFLGSFLFCLFITWYNAESMRSGYFDQGYVVACTLYVDTIFLLLVTPAFIATAFAKEHEWGNWDLLDTTLLKPREVLAGKFRAALVAAAIPMVASALATAPLLSARAYSPSSWAGYVTGLGTMAVCTLYLLCLTLLFTVKSRHSMQALMRGYGASAMAIVVFSGAIFFYLIMGSRYRSVDDGVEHVVNFVSPLLAQAMNLKDNRYELFTAYWVANAVCFLAISALLFWRAKTVFTRQMTRGAE